MPARPTSLPAAPAFSPDALRDLSDRAAAEGPRVERVEIEGETVWIKRAGSTQETGWHRLQRLLSVLAPHPMLRVTVDAGGAGSLEGERRRIEAFAQAGFLVPAIVLAQGNALAMSHLGDDLGRLQKADRPTFERCLGPLGDTLGHAHAAGLVHGRPSRRDLIFRDGTIGFLDFEEDPLSAMPLSVAQARDVWLLFIDLARAGLSPAELERCWAAYRPHLGIEVRAALGGPVRFAARASTIVAPLTAPFAGRDLKAPMAAARFLRAALGERS